MRQAPAAFITVYGQTRPLTPQHLTTIGRDAENDIVLPEPECSRRHCELLYNNGRWFLRDCDSRNGTFVNDKQITDEHLLQPGDVIRIALVKINFTILSGGDTKASMPAMDEASLEREFNAARGLPVERDDFVPLLGRSPATEELREQIKRAAPLNAPLLIQGPVGSGKGVVAQQVHLASGRLPGTFVRWDCNQFASTGVADSGRMGKITMPTPGGTLFLDEVSVLSPTDQSALITMLAQLDAPPADPTERRTRIMASTSIDLEAAASAGRFRHDLYLRLCVLTLTVKPLAERKEDVMVLADSFRQHFAVELGRAVEGFTPMAVRALESHSWPGNVRELENTIYRAVALCLASSIDSGDLHLNVKATGERVGSTIVPPYQGRSLEDVELSHILATLNATGWNKTRASQVLGIERSTLDRKLKRYGLNRPNASNQGRSDTSH
ncbi:Transcriptional regulatory protein ZraR [Caulifigura coniformis]|uniref:Transcriptional regulatory protein ZraR n=1 Tax=Caulifigura coniformis TaxID=2527983 RepID=A0A517SDG7_9PLAN|nr:FHA domain-containing protein [Caulifigura coniformis]QDT54174.1 Transcriptional regulatory protein ZraR [Caulifigura coniformis]